MAKLLRLFCAGLLHRLALAQFVPMPDPTFWHMFGLRLTCNDADSRCEYRYLLIENLDDPPALCSWNVSTQGAAHDMPASRAGAAQLPCADPALARLRTSAQWNSDDPPAEYVVLSVLDEDAAQIAWFGFDEGALVNGVDAAPVRATVWSMPAPTPRC